MVGATSVQVWALGREPVCVVVWSWVVYEACRKKRVYRRTKLRSRCVRLVKS